jgi:putative DNA primase/helicase
MDHNDQLKEYIARNYRLTPLRARSKSPIYKEWQSRPTDLAEFTPDRNVGIVLGTASCGLVDTDLDRRAATIATRYLLPPTGSIFGRPSKPSSHRLYRTPEPGRTVQLRGSDGRMIVELRAEGAQTMAPPSIHPEGERVEFEQNGEPASATRAELETGCRLIAAIVELSSHYNKGSRHAIALAFAGFLTNLGYDHPTMRASINALCAVAKDEELDNRLRGVDDTISQHRLGKPVQGRKALRELVGSPVVDHLTKLLDSVAADSEPSAREEGHHDLNDAANADRLVAMADGNLGYVPELQAFMGCEDGRWRRDESGLAVRRIAEQAVKAALEEESSGSPSRGGYKAHEYRLRFFERSLNLGAIRAAVEMAKCRVAIPLEQLDADPDLLGVSNGVLDLRTGVLRENAREDYITRSAGVGYDPTAQCPRFDQFMLEIFGSSPGLVAYVDGVLGYCLSARTHLQEFYLFTGDGANGKSTLVMVIQRLMGEYARPVLASTLFESHRSDQSDYDLALLPGVRLAVAQEAESKAQLHSARLKQLTGGDTIAARAICRAPFSFRPCAKIIMVANRRPELDAYDEALKRRVRVVPFDRQVPERQRDPDLPDKLTRELPGILNRLVRAGADYIVRKIATPEAVLKATTGYFFEKDNVAAYLAERTDKWSGALLPKTELLQDYADWCRMECLQPLGPRELNRVLRKKDYEEGRTNAVRGWKNLRLKHGVCDEQTQDDDLSWFTGAAANTA